MLQRCPVMSIFLQLINNLCLNWLFWWLLMSFRCHNRTRQTMDLLLLFVPSCYCWHQIEEIIILNQKNKNNDDINVHVVTFAVQMIWSSSSNIILFIFIFISFYLQVVEWILIVFLSLNLYLMFLTKQWIVNYQRMFTSNSSLESFNCSN